MKFNNELIIENSGSRGLPEKTNFYLVGHPMIKPVRPYCILVVLSKCKLMVIIETKNIFKGHIQSTVSRSQPASSE